VTGKGVQGRVGQADVALGNRQLMADLGLNLGGLQSQADALRREGQTVMFLAVDGRVTGLLGVGDLIKPSTPEALQALRQEGIRVVMLTGDSRTTA
jgi:P-type Cu+ transporter